MRARSFFYVCAGVLMLATAVHISAERAIAQADPEKVIEFELNDTNRLYALTNTGRMFRQGSTGIWTEISGPVGGTISVEKSTMGEVKGKYREEK